MIAEASATPVNFATTLLPSDATAVPADAEAAPEAEPEARPEPHQAPRREAHHHQAEAMEAQIYPPHTNFASGIIRPMIASELIRPFTKCTIWSGRARPTIKFKEGS